tara:strand:- start:3787 stop:5967 length:2181 start_codon:yes stop_codon:yes gene_type:complete
MDKVKLAELKRLVEKYTKGTGLFPEVMMAQILLESGNLESGLTTMHNNLSGQKIAHKDRTGKTKGVDYVLMATNEGFKTKKQAEAYQKKKLGQKYVVNSLKQNPTTKEWIVNYDGPFRKFATFEKGVEAHIDFLTGKHSTNQKNRYAGVRAAKTPEAQIIALKESGYATHGAYIEDITTKLDTIVLKEYPEYSDLTKLDKEVRVEIDRELENVYGPQIKKLRDAGFEDKAVELEAEVIERGDLLKEKLKGTTDTKAVTRALENEQKRFKSSEQQDKSKIPGRNSRRELTALEKAGIDSSPQDGYNDIVGDKRAAEIASSNDESILRLNEIIENKNDDYTYTQIRQAQKVLDELVEFNEENSNQIKLIDNPSQTDLMVVQETKALRLKLLGEVNSALDEIYVTEELEVEEEKRLELEEEEEPYDSTEGGKYVDVPNIEGVEYEEETTTDGLLSEGQSSEVSLDSELGQDFTDSEFKTETDSERKAREAEEAAAKLARKQARNAKIGKIAGVLGQAGKTAGVALMAGAGLKSMYEATREHKINKIRISPLMEEAFQKAKALSTQGMTYEERTAAMSDMNNAYAGAMKNVMAVSGGQRSSALANMGVVDASRVNALVDLAGKDAALRQGNMKIYQQQATSLGQMTLSADSTNEQLRATLEEGRKNRLTKIGDSLFSESIELSRNFADQKNNKDLLDNFAQLKKDVGTSDAELKALLQSLSGLNTGNVTD